MVCLPKGGFSPLCFWGFPLKETADVSFGNLFFDGFLCSSKEAIKIFPAGNPAIRLQGSSFWSKIESRIRYKFEQNVPHESLQSHFYRVNLVRNFILPLAAAEWRFETEESQMNQLNISFIGTGNMAGAIVRGLAQTQKGAVRMYLFDLDSDKANALAAETGSVAEPDMASAVKAGEIIVLAVKPQNMADLLEEIAPMILGAAEKKLVVSIAAGIELAVYERALPGVAVCRAMPNTSAAVLAAITGLMAGKNLADPDRVKMERIFNAIGSSLWIEEKDIHALIAVSGSGPAYFYYFTEIMAQVGQKLGLPADTAETLARHTAVGAGRMMAEKTESAETLRVQVTSPGGTTAEAIRVFSEKLPAVVEEAMTACADRSAEMAK